MPKYYCDYCDTFLTHDSPSVRKTHNGGRKHKENVRMYYQSWMESQAQKLVDATARAFTQQQRLGGGPRPQSHIPMPAPTALPYALIPGSMPQMPRPGMPGMPMGMPPMPTGPYPPPGAHAAFAGGIMPPMPSSIPFPQDQQ
jgi:U1 small nuclear ribonucleoprotein C|uniref:U1 small nuclear ribonucleoprotein C n=1 Tax=Panagrolaimus sp. PS1159 TaxID=55785 RepID=A0AC35FM84_9BILA